MLVGLTSVRQASHFRRHVLRFRSACLLAPPFSLAWVLQWSTCAALAQGRYFESLAASSIAVRSSQFEPPLDAAELKEVIAGTLQRLEHRCRPTKPWTYLLPAAC